MNMYTKNQEKSMAEQLPHKCEALSSNSSTTKKKEKMQGNNQ
jgi:hypothetical protein